MACMREFLRRWWPVIKMLMVVAVILGVGWHLFGILRNEELRDGDVVVAGSESGVWVGRLGVGPDAALLLLIGLKPAGVGTERVAPWAGHELEGASDAAVFIAPTELTALSRHSPDS